MLPIPSADLRILRAAFALAFVFACSAPARRDVTSTPRATTADDDHASPFDVPSLTTSGRVSVAPGKVTVVEFWATWNEPCKKAVPKLQALYDKYHAQGLEIAALSVDEEPTGVADAAKQWGAQFPVGWDGDHAIAKRWMPRWMPTFFVVDREGTIVAEHAGWREGAEADLERDIARVLSPPPASQIAEAQRLRAEGKAFFDRGEHEQALARFREAARLWFDASTLYDLGRTLEAMGQRKEAAEVYYQLLQTRMTHIDRSSMELRVQQLMKSE